MEKKIGGSLGSVMAELNVQQGTSIKEITEMFNKIREKSLEKLKSGFHFKNIENDVSVVITYEGNFEFTTVMTTTKERAFLNIVGVCPTSLGKVSIYFTIETGSQLFGLKAYLKDHALYRENNEQAPYSICLRMLSVYEQSKIYKEKTEHFFERIRVTEFPQWNSNALVHLG